MDSPSSSNESDSTEKHNACDYDDCIESTDPEKPFICDVDGCTRIYTNFKHLEIHMASDHNVICVKGVPLSDDDDQLLDENEENKKKYVCTYEGCAESFSKRRKLINHVRGVHTGDRPFICEINGCEKAYTNSSHLIRHQKNFHDDKAKQKKQVTCPYDGKTFSELHNLKRHLGRFHDPSAKKYAFNCLECNQGFPKKLQLDSHTCSNTTLPFECQVCKECFASIGKMNRHKRTHTVYPCACGEKFERYTNFRSHQKSCDSLMT